MSVVPGDGPPSRVLIMGAAGRDFHNFNVVFRDDPAVRVVAFTAAQIPDIAGRRYPASLAGRRYPDGIPIYPEADLPRLIRDERVDWVYLSYSDLAHTEVMHRASTVLAAGASFGLLGPACTMLVAQVPVLSVGAVRTGVGKSAFARHVLRWLKARGHRPVALRHPMPYGDLAQQAVQRFASYEDLDLERATVEEREEYEPYIESGAVVYAGVDYARVLDAAQHEADVIIWDGGNNDFPFLRPNLHVVLLDAHRPGDELAYHPGETNLRMADVLIISKVDSAPADNVALVEANARAVQPEAPLLLGELEVIVDTPDRIAGKRVVLVEDGPTLTHGGMRMGAGTVAAERYHAGAIVDARPHAVGALAATFRDFPHLQGEVPAMGYSPQQLQDLEATLRRVPADVVIDATPANLSRLLQLDKPIVDVRYEFKERGDRLPGILAAFEQRWLSRRRDATCDAAC
jgi:predicted GTPase